MYKSKSTSSIKNPIHNLARSIKHSIDKDLRKLSAVKNHKPQTKQLYKNKLSASMALLPKSTNTHNKKTTDFDMLNQYIFRNVQSNESQQDCNTVKQRNSAAYTNQLKQFHSQQIATQSTYYPQPCATDENRNRQKQLRSLQAKQKQLYKRIQQLQNQVSTTKELVSTKIKPHNILLEDYDRINNQLVQKQYLLTKNKEELKELCNRLHMFSEDQQSKKYQVESLIAQQEYLQQMITVYKHQYPSESQVFLKIVAIQIQNDKINDKIQQQQQFLSKLQSQLINFKEQTKYQLQQNIIRKKVSEIRISIMAHLNQADQFLQSVQKQMSNAGNGRQKIWQLLCAFVSDKKKIGYQILDGWDQHGIQGWLCGNGLLSEWQEYLYRYRIKSKKGSLKYPPKLLQKYFETLKKLEILLTNSKLDQHKKDNARYIKQIQQVNLVIIALQQQKDQNTTEIKRLQQQMQKQLGQEAMGTIQYLQQQKSLTYSLTKINKHTPTQTDQSLLQLSTIKQTLKQLKAKHIERTQKIQKYQRRLNQIEEINLQVGYSIQYMNNRQELESLISCKSMENKQIKTKIDELEGRKIETENKINEVIDKWRLLDQNKIKLKNLYRELNQINKSIDSIKIGAFHHKISDQNYHMIKTKKNFEPQTKPLAYTLRLNSNRLKLGSTTNYNMKVTQQIGQLKLKKTNKQNIFSSINSKQTKAGNEYHNNEKIQTSKKKCRQNNDYENIIEQTITRKPSLWGEKLRKSASTFSGFTGPKQSNKIDNNNRNSLTAMLLSRLAQ